MIEQSKRILTKILLVANFCAIVNQDQVPITMKNKTDLSPVEKKSVDGYKPYHMVGHTLQKLGKHFQCSDHNNSSIMKMISLL